jgi:hypothetical protein
VAKQKKSAPSATPRWQTWLSYVLSAAPVLLMLFSASGKLLGQAQTVEMFTSRYGFPAGSLFGIGLLEVATVVVYLIPQTSVLGAILLCSYLGGAVVTEFRVGGPLFFIPGLLGVLAWGGLYLRDRRLRELIPLRRAKG